MTQSTTRSRKFKAILAGGIVLGVGAAVTLAAWTDNEWAEGTFGAGTFNVQGSTTGEEGSFKNHESAAGAADLTFDIPASTNMFPGETVAVPFVLRLDGATTYDANVVLESAAGSGANEEHLTYGIVKVADAASCTATATATATGDTIVPANTVLDSVAEAQGFDLTVGAGAAAGAPVTLCFQVAAGNNLTQGATADAQWQFTATSAE